jgi:predicted ATPase/class 3 adenylate cyclase/Tfp pilus assembly protein PilF
MSDLRALLLTDVVDSTKLSQQVGDSEMARLWTAHDRAARDLLRDWHGREIDKSDGMLLLFDAAADAVGYALAYQKALNALVSPLKARAGLHFGPVTLRENSQADVAMGAKPLEVEGTAKAIAARVMSVANGGQILLSAHVRAAVGDPGQLHLQSHGQWRFKGLTEPIELFEVGDADAPFTPPPDGDKAYRVVWQDGMWRPVRGIQHTLPAERDCFVGRSQALLELSRRLSAGARLVSVLGPGGTGKTRLATRFGWHWLGDFPGGVWFCDLSQARNLDGIARAVAQGLEISLSQGDPVTQLGNAIAGRDACLVILDNFEQVARFARDTLGHWLDRAADAHFLVTTREVLGLVGEEVLALAPLLPGDAATLFLQRAEAAKPDFLPNAEDQAAIGPLVELLEGLPLAIELAAARVRVMPPRTLLLRMSERFKLLTSAGGRVERQATLRAVFDWSWELLSLPEKAALAKLSTFEGGLTLEAAETVLDLSAYENAPSPLDALQSLVQKSFVRQVRDARFDMLVSAQEYAAEHLRTPARYAGSGPAAALAAQTRHGVHFAGLGEGAATASASIELENFVVACRRAVGRGDADMATSLLEGAWRGLQQHGPFRVGDELASLVLSMPALGAAATARAQLVAGNALQWWGRDVDASLRFEAALALARGMGDRRIEAESLRRLGHLDDRAGRMESARSRLSAAMTAAQDLRDRRLESDVRNGLGNLAASMVQNEDARVHYESALAWVREVGDRHREAGILGNLGGVCSNQGRMDEALACYEAALVAARETGSLHLASNTQCNLGNLLHLLGRPAEAHAHLEAALAAARKLGHAQNECNALCNLGLVFESLARPDQAQAHFEAALALARTLGDTHSEGQILGYFGLLHARQGRHDDARRCFESGEALLRAASDQFGLGVLLTGRAEAHHLSGDPAASAALAAAASIAADVGTGPASELGLALARVCRLAELRRT